MSLKTSKKIIDAALELMSERGFHAVSTKEIAAKANVSEMTLFRHFNTKLGILEAVVQTYSYSSRFAHLFAELLRYELEPDLLLFSNKYVEEMMNNRSIFLIAIQERGRFPQIIELIAEHNSLSLRDRLAQYFEVMQHRGAIQEGDTKQFATQYLSTLYGYCATILLWSDHPFYADYDQFINDAVTNFIHGIGTK